jgi:hypothetical protein
MKYSGKGFFTSEIEPCGYNALGSGSYSILSGCWLSLVMIGRNYSSGTANNTIFWYVHMTVQAAAEENRSKLPTDAQDLLRQLRDLRMLQIFSS